MSHSYSLCLLGRRALLRDPTLILCDEVTSSVDAFAERDIVRTLRSAALDRTTITVAHRLSSIVHCDNILVIDRSGHLALIDIKINRMYVPLR